jgi:hypothetical protein
MAVAMSYVRILGVYFEKAVFPLLLRMKSDIFQQISFDDLGN